MVYKMLVEFAKLGDFAGLCLGDLYLILTRHAAGMLEKLHHGTGLLEKIKPRP